MTMQPLIYYVSIICMAPHFTSFCPRCCLLREGLGPAPLETRAPPPEKDRERCEVATLRPRHRRAQAFRPPTPDSQARGDHRRSTAEHSNRGFSSDVFTRLCVRQSHCAKAVREPSVGGSARRSSWKCSAHSPQG